MVVNARVKKILEYINNIENAIKQYKENMNSKKVVKEYKFKIAKSDEEKRIAFGWAMISRTSDGEVVTDLQGDQIEPDVLEDLAYKYVKLYRDVGQMHETDNEGCVVESFVSTLDKQKALGIPEGCVPVGWWIGLYIENDEAWELIKNGTYKAFSIEGTATREEVEEE
jgi:hypothetical protein